MSTNQAPQYVHVRKIHAREGEREGGGERETDRDRETETEFDGLRKNEKTENALKNNS